MNRKALVKLIGVPLCGAALVGCLELPREDPTAEYKDFVAKLHGGGEAQGGDGAAADPMAQAKQAYQNNCSSCHGAEGAGDGAAAAAMNPKPRNFTDAAWQAKVDDAHIAKTIKEGGAAVGLSPTMPAWGSVVNDEQIEGLVKLIRSFKK